MRIIATRAVAQALHPGPSGHGAGSRVTSRTVTRVPTPRVSHDAAEALSGPMPASRPTPRALALALALAPALAACAPTVRTPLKQALPSVTGASSGVSAPCLGDPTRIDLGGVARGGVKADLDGDGIDDLALAVAGAGGGGAAVFFLHDGQGGLRESMKIPIPQTPTSIAAGDFNLDGIDDLAIGAAAPAALHVLLGRGRGEFIAGAIELKDVPAGLWTVDLDGNNAPDLLALDERGNAVQALLGDGHGEFKAGPRSGLPTRVTPAALTLADADRDGRLDLVALGESGRDAMLHFVRGDGKGGFGKVMQRRTVGRGPRAVLGAPLGGDEGHDLIALVDAAGEGGTTPVAAVLIGTGPLEYSAVGYFVPGPIGDATLDDLDLDGDADLIASAADGSALHVVPGDGRAGLGAAQSRRGGGFGSSVLVIGAGRRPLVLSFGPNSQHLHTFGLTRCAPAQTP